MVGSIEHQLVNAWDHLQGRPREPGQNNPLNEALPEVPFSEAFSLPEICSCGGRVECEAVYCSDACRDAAWSAHHSLLCPTPAVVRPDNLLLEEDLYLPNFYDHSDRFNAKFRLAAQAIANILVTAQRSVESRGFRPSVESAETNWAALIDAWAPYSLGYKALWWETAPVPPDLSFLPREDLARAEMKEQAKESLRLLTTALQHRAPSLCAAFPAILQLDIWGTLICMFELQLHKGLLNVTIASPVPAWARVLMQASHQGLSQDRREILGRYEAISAHGGIETIQRDYVGTEWFCGGSGFYPLQPFIKDSRMGNTMEDERTGNANGEL